MTSKDLVPTTGKDLAVIEEPAPLWEMAVKHVLLEIQSITKELLELDRDREALPDDIRAGLQHLNRKIVQRQGKLTNLVNRMDEGTWMDGRERLPELETDGPETAVLRGSKMLIEMTPEEVGKRWDALTHGERVRWALDREESQPDR